MVRRSLLRVFLLLSALLIASSAAQAQDSLDRRNQSLKATGRPGVLLTLCHIPPGNPDNAHTITVAEWAVAAHLAHGDTLGDCADECDGVPSPVPQTGQTECWDETGGGTDCAGTGQDGEYQMGTSVDPRFTDNGDGTVTDNLTALVWLKNANCFGRRTGSDALDAANNLKDGDCDLTDDSIAGDWRLPNVRELHSLIDFAHINPALPPDSPFSGVQSGSYWSSTGYAFYPIFAWVVIVSNGNVSPVNEINIFHVWPVRGGL